MNLFTKYKDFRSSYLRPKDNDTHQDIVDELKQKLNEHRFEQSNAKTPGKI